MNVSPWILSTSEIGPYVWISTFYFAPSTQLCSEKGPIERIQNHPPAAPVAAQSGLGFACDRSSGDRVVACGDHRSQPVRSAVPEFGSKARPGRRFERAPGLFPSSATAFTLGQSAAVHRR